MAVRVLIVDDSHTMRAMLRYVLERDSDLEVIGEAADPYEAREEIKRLDPDVLTLDIEMPRMNGIEFLKRLMVARPMPVVMVSTLTQVGADNTLAALEIGAVDFIAKPTGRDAIQGLSALPRKVKWASRAKLSASLKSAAPVAASPLRKTFNPGRKAVAIGASTGGVEALLKVIRHFPANCPPTLIVQHMPAHFTTSFARRLDSCTQANVQEAEDGLALKKGNIYLAPGGDRHLHYDFLDGGVCKLIEGEPCKGHTPSVDIMFQSFASFGKRAVGVILTGMGSDGAEGLKAIRDAGGHTIGQNEATSIVYGMPRVANELGAVERQLPLNLIGPAIMEACDEQLQISA